MKKVVSFCELSHFWFVPLCADLGLVGGPGVTQPLAGQEAQTEGGDAEEHRLVEGEGGLLHEVTELVRGDPEHERRGQK